LLSVIATHAWRPAATQTVLGGIDPAMAAAIADGWLAARGLSAGGGAPGPLLDRVNAALRRVDLWRGAAERGTTPQDAVRALELQYVDAAIRAAVDAAQDERAEMAVFLTQARHLAERLDLMGRRAILPLPIDELEGELWLEVDQFAEAREAYRRATAIQGDSGRAWMGLARASVPLGDAPEACRAYRRALTLNLLDEWRAEASRYVGSSACGRR
jgi:tetratricopeptide (TPR) repeat protein